MRANFRIERVRERHARIRDEISSFPRDCVCLPGPVCVVPLKSEIETGNLAGLGRREGNERGKGLQLAGKGQKGKNWRAAKTGEGLIS